MELWIRDQERHTLRKVECVYVEKFPIVNNGFEHCIYGYPDETLLGKYTKERAMEILDEIQNKMKKQFIVKSTPILSTKDIDREEIRLENKYNAEFIMQDSAFEILPINGDFILYEMPKE